MEVIITKSKRMLEDLFGNFGGTEELSQTFVGIFK